MAEKLTAALAEQEGSPGRRPGRVPRTRLPCFPMFRIGEAGVRTAVMHAWRTTWEEALRLEGGRTSSEFKGKCQRLKKTASTAATTGSKSVLVGTAL